LARMITLKTLLRAHPGVAVGMSLAASSYLLSVGYELYYQRLQITASQAGYSGTEIPRTALVAAGPLLLAFFAVAGAYLFLTGLVLSLMTHHDELGKSEGRTVARLAVVIATLVAVGIMEAIELGAPLVTAAPVAGGFVWGCRIRTRRLGWVRAFSIPTFRRQGGRLLLAGIAQAAACFGAFGLALWLVPRFGKPILDWWLLPVFQTAFVVWPLIAAWLINRRERRCDPPVPTTRTAGWVGVIVLALVLVSPATLGQFSGQLAQAGVIFDEFVPGFGAPRVTCKHVAWQGRGLSPFPSTPVLHLGHADGMGQWFDARTRVLITQPIGSTTMTPAPAHTCRVRRAP
jgi:hypothetical protein